MDFISSTTPSNLTSDLITQLLIELRLNEISTKERNEIQSIAPIHHLSELIFLGPSFSASIILSPYTKLKLSKAMDYIADECEQGRDPEMIPLEGLARAMALKESRNRSSLLPSFPPSLSLADSSSSAPSTPKGSVPESIQSIRSNVSDTKHISRNNNPFDDDEHESYGRRTNNSSILKISAIKTPPPVTSDANWKHVKTCTNNYITAVKLGPLLKMSDDEWELTKGEGRYLGLTRTEWEDKNSEFFIILMGIYESNLVSQYSWCIAQFQKELDGRRAWASLSSLFEECNDEVDITAAMKVIANITLSANDVASEVICKVMEAVQVIKDRGGEFADKQIVNAIMGGISPDSPYYVTKSNHLTGIHHYQLPDLIRTLRATEASIATERGLAASRRTFPSNNSSPPPSDKVNPRSHEGDSATEGALSKHIHPSLWALLGDDAKGIIKTWQKSDFPDGNNGRNQGNGSYGRNTGGKYSHDEKRSGDKDVPLKEGKNDNGDTQSSSNRNKGTETIATIPKTINFKTGATSRSTKVSKIPAIEPTLEEWHSWGDFIPLKESNLPLEALLRRTSFERTSIAVVDSGTETNVLNKKQVLILDSTSEHINLYGTTSDETISCQIVTIATVVTNDLGERIILVGSQSAVGEQWEGDSLINPNTLINCGWKVDLTPHAFGGNQDMYLQEHNQVIPFKIVGGMTVLEISKPTTNDMSTLRRYNLSTETSWDHMRKIPDTRPSLPHSSTRRTYGDNDDDVKRMAEVFGDCPIDVAMRITSATTSYARDNNSDVARVKDFHRSRMPEHTAFHRLRAAVCSDTFESSTISKKKNRYAQIYYFPESHSAYVYPSKSKSANEIGGTFLTLIKEVGIPDTLRRDNSRQQEAGFDDICDRFLIQPERTEPMHPHQNPGERGIETIKSITARIMNHENVPEDLWDYAVTHGARLWRSLPNKNIGYRTPDEYLLGDTPDISWARFHFYEKVIYLDLTAPFPATKELPGRYLGQAPGGDILASYILTETDQIIVRSALRKDDGSNLRLNRKTTTIDGSDPSTSTSSVPHQQENKLDADIPALMSVQGEKRHGHEHGSLIGRILRKADENGKITMGTVEGRNKDKTKKNYLIQWEDATSDSWTQQEMNNHIANEEEKNGHVEPTYVIERLIAHRKRNEKLEIQVKWSIGGVTWEPFNSSLYIYVAQALKF